jgi:hypothetical protein
MNLYPFFPKFLLFRQRYVPGNMRAICRLLLASTMALLPNWRFRFRLFFVRICLLKAWLLLSLPVPVLENLLAAARFVFIFGI